MPSLALRRWTTSAKEALDEIEAAHTAVGGEGPGRWYATLQVNHAYAMLLSSQFQGFCRNLHSEAVDFLVTSPSDPWPGELLRMLMTRGRKLDHGNPNPGNIGADFSSIGMRFWDEARRLDGRTDARKAALEELNDWRNAIAHQDWTNFGGNPKLRVGTVRRWRQACNSLAVSFDRAVHAHLLGMVGRAPW